jgi:hypothetical protein
LIGDLPQSWVLILAMSGADGIVTQQELSANFWDCSDPYFELKASVDN